MFIQRSFHTIVLLCIITILTSCNGTNSNQVSTDSINVTSGDKEIAAPRLQNLIGTYLDTLWVDDTSFLNLQNKNLAFRFYIDTAESIMMNGWTIANNGNGTYSTNADIILSKGRASNKIQYKAGNYLGNLLLSHQDITTINRFIQQYNAKYVLFAPIDPALASFKGQITYEIMVTSDDPHSYVLNAKTATSTTVITNPSPPGSAN